MGIENGLPYSVFIFYNKLPSYGGCPLIIWPHANKFCQSKTVSNFCSKSNAQHPPLGAMKTRACSLAQSIATPESKVLSNALSATSSHTGNWVKHSSSNDVFVQKGGVPSKIRWLSVYFHWHCHVLGKFGGKPPISWPKWSPTPLMLWFSISAVENSWCSKGTTWVPGSCKEQILHISVWSYQVRVHLKKNVEKITILDGFESETPQAQCLWKCHHIYSSKPSIFIVAVLHKLRQLAFRILTARVCLTGSIGYSVANAIWKEIVRFFPNSESSKVWTSNCAPHMEWSQNHGFT